MRSLTRVGEFARFGERLPNAVAAAVADSVPDAQTEPTAIPIRTHLAPYTYTTPINV